MAYFFLQWMSGIVDVCIICKHLQGACRTGTGTPACTTSNDGQLNAKIPMDSGTAAGPVRCELSCRKRNPHELELETWNIEMKLQGFRCRYAAYFRTKINMHGDRHIDPTSMDKLADGFSTRLNGPECLKRNGQGQRHAATKQAKSGSPPSFLSVRNVTRATRPLPYWYPTHQLCGKEVFPQQKKLSEYIILV